MEIVHQSERRLEVRISGRPRAVRGLVGAVLGALFIWLGMREASVLPLAAGVFVAVMGLSTVWVARDVRHLIDADAGTATAESRRLVAGGAGARRLTMVELAHVSDVELEERRGTVRARRRGRRHPTWRLAYRMDDGRLVPWSDVFGTNRENLVTCLTAARAVLNASRIRHPGTA